MATGQKGLYKDSSPANQPEDTLRDAQNVVLDENRGSIINELGTEEITSISSADTILGSILLSDNRKVLFAKHSDVSPRIVLIDENYNDSDHTDALRTTLLSMSDLEFNNRIQAVSKENSKGEHVVYFVDGENPIRFINVDKQLKDSYISNIEDLSLFPIIDSPASIEVDSVNSTGGSLSSGAYYFAVAYVLDDDTRTNYFAVTNSVNITNSASLGDYSSYDGAEPDSPTSKSITLRMDDVDTSYKAVSIAVISRIDGVIQTVKQLPDINIQGSSTTYTHTGQESHTELSLEDILVDGAFYESAGTIAQNDSSLYLGDLKGREDIGYQKYANAIKLTSKEQMLPNIVKGDVNDTGPSAVESDVSYKNPIIAHSMKGFRRDEIYAFYISFLLKDGSESKAYHIPGKEPKSLGTAYEAEITINEDAPQTEATNAESEIIVTGNSVASGDEHNIIITVDGNDTSSISVTDSDTISSIADKIRLALDATSSITDDWDTSRTGSGTVVLTAKEEGRDWNGIAVSHFETGDDGSSASDISIDTSSTSGAIDDEEDYVADIAIELDGTVNSEDEEFTNNSSKEDIAQLLVNSINTFTTNTEIVQPYNASRDGNKVLLKSSRSMTPSNWQIAIERDIPFDLSIDISVSQPTDSGDQVTEADASINSLPYFEEIDDFSGAKAFQFDGTPEENDMAYWENEQDEYDDGDDWDIWTIDSNGDGEDTGDTLRNTPVRHHHFPDFTDNMFYENKNAYPLGFELENINIPNDIKDKVKAFKIYYAKRDGSNSTVVDQVRITNLIENDNVYKAAANGMAFSGGVLSGDKTETAFSAYGFNTLRTRKDIGEVTHIKSAAILSTPGIDESSNEREMFQQFMQSPDEMDNDDSRFLKSIKAKAYVDHDESNVSLQQLGFDHDMDNEESESKIVFETYTDLDAESSSNELIPPLLYNLHQHRTNMYLSFDSQELVFTGYIQSVDSSNTYSTDVVMGGDSYITTFAHKATDNRSTVDAGKHGTLFYFPTESIDLVGLRHAGAEEFEIYFPGRMNYERVLFPIPESEENPRMHDNYYGYNEDYSASNDIKPPDPRSQDTQTDFTTRIARSVKDTNEIADNYRVFLDQDYMDLPRNRGRLINISSYNNIIIPHFERGMMRTRGREEIAVEDFRAFVGTGDIFAVSPDEIISTDEGYAGIQNARSAIVTKHGYFFADSDAGKIFHLGHEGLNEISALGLRSFFRDNLQGDVKTGYDPMYNRILFTTDDFTISYNPDSQSWRSFHDYKPTEYIRDLRDLISIDDTTLYKHNVGNAGDFYGDTYPSSIQFVDNQDGLMPKIAIAIRANTICNDSDDNEILDETFTKVRVRNSYQDSGEIDVKPFPQSGSNARRTQRLWAIKGFRNILTDGEPNLSKPWYDKERLVDNYHIVDLIYDNDNKLEITYFQVINRQAGR